MTWLASKPAAATFAILLSLALWIYVQSQAQPIDNIFSNVPLELRGLSDGLIVVGEKAPMVKLVAHGPAEIVNRIHAEDVKPYVDLSKIGPGVKKAFKVSLEGASRDKDRGIEWTLASISLQIDSVDQADLAVKIVTKGSLPSPNLRYDGENIFPEKVRISGAASLVRTVRTARAVLDLSTVHQGAAQNLDVELLDRDRSVVEDLTVEPRSVRVGPIINPAEQTRLLFVNASFEGTQPDIGYRFVRARVVPAQVRVDGPSGALARLRSTTIATRRIDLTGLKQDTTFQVELATEALRGLKPEVHTVQVTVEIAPVTPRSVIP